jgi:hypothetical protein
MDGRLKKFTAVFKDIRSKNMQRRISVHVEQLTIRHYFVFNKIYVYLRLN